MLEDQPRFIADLARLPQTLCHHDTARSNLIARRRDDGATDIVAIDWESTRPGAVGAEIATLVSANLRKGDFPADRAAELDTAVVEAYLAGLRDAGWSGDPRMARLGYAMSLALRCWFVRDTLRNITDSDARPVFGRALHVPPKTYSKPSSSSAGSCSTGPTRHALSRRRSCPGDRVTAHRRGHRQ